MRKYLIIIGALMLSFAMVGCTSKEKNIDIDVSAMADALKENVKFKDELMELDDNVFDMVYVIDQDDIASKKIYISSGATAEEIAVIEGKDDESAKQIREGLLQRIEDEKVNFESYIPEEMKKLNSPVLEVKGKYVIMCISDDNETAKKIIDGQ